MMSSTETAIRPVVLIGPFMVFALMLTSCSAADAPPDVSGCELRVAWDPYEPYSYSTGGVNPVGYDIDVVSRVAEEIGCSLTFTEMSWSDILVALQDGATDVTIGTGYKEARAEWSWYSESYRDEVIGLLMRKNAAKNFPGKSLEGILLGGLVLGKTTDDTYDKATEAIFARYDDQIKARVSEADNLARLLDGAIDGFLVEVNVASALVKRKAVADSVEFHPLVFPAGAYRLQVSKKTVSAERLAEINAAIQRLAASGWMSETLKTYSIQ